MRIVKKVDPSLLDMQMSLKIESLFGDTADSKVITTLLDICYIRYAEDGSRYTVNMLELIRNVEKTESKPRVFKEIVESVLLNMRTSRNAFCSTNILPLLIDIQKVLISHRLLLPSLCSLFLNRKRLWDQRPWSLHQH